MLWATRLKPKALIVLEKSNLPGDRWAHEYVVSVRLEQCQGLVIQIVRMANEVDASFYRLLYRRRRSRMAGDPHAPVMRLGNEYLQLLIREAQHTGFDPSARGD